MLVGVIAQNESPFVALTGYGALGIIALMFIIGRIVPSSMLDRAEIRADKAQERSQVMLDDYKAVVPVLQDAIRAINTADQARQAGLNQDAEMRVLLAQVRDVLRER